MHRLIPWLCAVALIVGLSGLVALRQVENQYQNYSTLRAAELLIKDYLSNTKASRFPGSWRDLAQDVHGSGPAGFTWRELSERVVIDWDAGSRCLEMESAIAPDESPSLRVISLPDGSRGLWHGDDPNRNLVRYLRECGRNRKAVTE